MASPIPSTPKSALLPRIGSLWIGEELGWLEQICLMSFVEHGHEVTLFATSPALRGLPPGVQLRDANEIFPCQTIVRDPKSGSPALHADMFRYAMLAQTDLIWVDTDVLCLQPLLVHEPYLFGFEDKNTVNNAVLRLPKESSTLRKLLRYRPDTRGYPPFFSTRRKIKYWLKSGGRPPHISRWPWGSIGPKGLTHFLRASGEIAHARPVEAFYPLHYHDVTQLICAPKAGAALHFSSDSYYLHLWGKELRNAIKSQGLHPESFLAHEKARLSQLFHFSLAA